MTEFTSYYNDISVGDLENLEQNLEITLPDDYKKLILKYNGASVPLDRGYLFNHKEEILIFSKFHPIKEGRNTVEKYHSHKHSFLYPKLLPIGIIVGGYLAMSVDETDKGAMYVYYSDALPEKITNSFSEFIDNLEVVDIDEM